MWRIVFSNFNKCVRMLTRIFSHVCRWSFGSATTPSLSTSLPPLRRSIRTTGLYFCVKSRVPGTGPVRDVVYGAPEMYRRSMVDQTVRVQGMVKRKSATQEGSVAKVVCSDMPDTSCTRRRHVRVLLSHLSSAQLVPYIECCPDLVSFLQLGWYSREPRTLVDLIGRNRAACIHNVVQSANDRWVAEEIRAVDASAWMAASAHLRNGWTLLRSA